MEMKEEKLEEFKELDLALEVTENKSQFGLEPGTYVFVYVGTKKGIGEKGEYLIHKWEEVETGTWVTEVSSLKVSPKSKLWDIFAACGVPVSVGKPANIKDLIGKSCMIQVQQDGEYMKVKTHMALPKQKEAAKTGGQTSAPSGDKWQLDQHVSYNNATLEAYVL
jgi:hypothetical protein